MNVRTSDYPNVATRAAELDCSVPTAIALLPVNFLTARTRDELADDEYAPEVRDAWRQSGLEETPFLDRGGRFVIRVEESLSETVRLSLFVSSLLLTQNPHAVNLALGVIANKVTEILKNQAAPPKVALTVIVERVKDIEYTKVEYSGDVAGLTGVAEVVKGLRRAGGEER
jgi:hypothetical protein